MFFFDDDGGNRFHYGAHLNTLITPYSSNVLCAKNYEFPVEKRTNSQMILIAIGFNGRNEEICKLSAML